jgi:hypothetical protein
MTKLLAVVVLRRLYLLATLLAAVIALTLLAPQAGEAEATLIDFEDLAPGTTVTTQYGDRGVLFFSNYLDSDPAARSGTRVIRSDNPTHEFNPGPMVFGFTSGQRFVRLFAGFPVPIDGTMRAYDEFGGLIAQDGPKPVIPNAFTTPFEVSMVDPLIRRIELEMGTTAFEAFDDLEFDGEGPPPPPTEPPVVEITSPLDGAELDTSAITVQGTVSGLAVFPVATLSLETGLPPDSTAPPLTAGMSLVGAGTTRTFSLDLGVTLGPHLLTVEAENTGNLTGSDTLRFTNLPPAIRQRFAAEGGATTFGELQYGGVKGDCKMAVYESGAIFVVGSSTFIAVGDIFDKWFSLRDQGAFFSRLGCPTSQERDALGGARAQDFTDGRIYANLTTGSHYVPGVFVDAIDQLGGEAANGVPIMDPTSSSGVMQTWLFQRFSRPDQQFLLPSTLEIRGSPPTLWVERHGGDLQDLFLDEGQSVVFPRVPTLWLQFPCSGVLGPCQVAPPSSGPPLENAGGRFCDGTTYPWGPPEWSPVLGDHVTTPLLGIVRDSHKAGEDNPLTHEYFEGVEKKFSSDWNVGVQPLHPFRSLRAENTFVEVEFEAYFIRAFMVQFDLPFRNDLYFAAGRWIIDCGHTPYRSEIHPPFVGVHMLTETFNNRPATQANIWVNGYYTGAPVSIDIFPPPRPSPDALLSINKPIDQQAALGVDVEFSTPASTQARVRFSASPRQVEVTGAGEMKWEAGRGYYGRWHVYWSE